MVDTKRSTIDAEGRYHTYEGTSVLIDPKDNTHTYKELASYGEKLSGNGAHYGKRISSIGYRNDAITNEGISFVNRETRKPVSALTVNFYAYKNRVKNWLKSLF